MPLERIEESFLRQTLKTKKGCPIKEIYLKLGLAPSWFDIFKLKKHFLEVYIRSGRTKFNKKYVPTSGQATFQKLLGIRLLGSGFLINDKKQGGSSGPGAPLKIK